MPTASKARTAVALFIVFAGLGFIGLVPYARWTYSRDRRDLERARTPLLRVPLADLQLDQDRGLTVVPPGDAQWQRLVRRLGKPAFVLVVATDRTAIQPQAYSATDAQLRVRGTQTGRPLEISVTKELPFDYSSTAAQTAYRFSSVSDDVIQLTVRLVPAGVPDGALLMVFPLWNHLEMWHWGDSLSMGQGFFELLVPVLLFAGVIAILVGTVVGLRPLKPTR